MNQLPISFCRVFILTILLFANFVVSAQTVVDIQPNITKSIAGHSVLDRNKYFNLCYLGVNFEAIVGNATISNRYLNDLEIGFGRVLGLVTGATKYTKNILQDSARPGYVNVPYLIANAKPTNGTTAPSAAIMARFPNSIGTIYTDTHNSYPAFMKKEVYAGSTDSIPLNKIAAAEIAVSLLKYNFTDWTRPIAFEPINEPTWQLIDKTKMLTNLADFHNQMLIKAKSLGVSTLIGGPCSSFSAYYNGGYGDFRKFSDFVDATSANLDFYSFHAYDFHRWDSINHKQIGRVTSGLPLEGIMDLVAAYGKVTYNKDLKFYSSEHGGTLSVPDQKKAMQKWFIGTGSGFAYDMKAKSITDFLMVNSCISNTMVFMDRPQLVAKVTPFILLESFAWDPKYHASILVANNYTDKKNWYESAQINFFKYFQGVKGRRILTKCIHPDIQQQAYVNGNKLIVLLNNLSDNSITLSLNYPTLHLDSLVLRRLVRNADYTPTFSQSEVTDAQSITLTGKESAVLFCNYNQPIAENYQVEENPYYATEMMRQFSTNSLFNVAIPGLNDIEYAYLRIGIGRGTGTDRNISVWLNGTQLTVPMELSAARLEDGSGYGSTKIIQVDKALLQTANVVKVAFNDGKTGGVGAVTLCVGTKKAPSAVSEIDAEPAILNQNFPNPAKNTTVLSFSLINPTRASLKVFDVAGKEIQTVASGTFQPGKYQYNFSTKGLTKGVYFYRLTTESGELIEKMVVE